MTDPIDYISARIAGWIKRTNPEETDDLERMIPTLSLVINNVLTTGFILLIGYLTESLFSTGIMLATFALCRIMLKGCHLKSMTLCVIITTLFIYLVSIIPVNPLWMIILNPICIVWIFLRSSAKASVKLLLGTLMACNMIFLYPPVFLGFVAQTLTLIPQRR
jgi:accessory gene regulator B